VAKKTATIVKSVSVRNQFYHLLNDLLYCPATLHSIFSYLLPLKNKNVMKTLTNRYLILAIMLFAGYTAMAQKATVTEAKMKTYLIEREIPGAGTFTAEKLKAISQTSCTVLKEMGPGIQWIQSYVTGNKIYCIYKAESAELIKEHAKKGGFPANSIIEISSIISPATAE
jgi:hypothetical protein